MKTIDKLQGYIALAMMAESMSNGIVHERQEISEKKITDRLRIKKGHKVFKMINGEISEVGENEYAESLIETTYGGDFPVGRKVRKLIPEEGALYISALNLKNAKRKFCKLSQ